MIIIFVQINSYLKAKLWRVAGRLVCRVLSTQVKGTSYYIEDISYAELPLFFRL